MKKPCRYCKYGEFRRVNRHGWIEREVLSRFGWFPWECVICRRRKLFRSERENPAQSTGFAHPDGKTKA